MTQHHHVTSSTPRLSLSESSSQSPMTVSTIHNNQLLLYQIGEDYTETDGDVYRSSHQHNHPYYYNHQQAPQNQKYRSQQHQHRNPFISRSPCVICSDRARGCNFGAITCASCKEFFRRNAFKLNVSKYLINIKNRKRKRWNLRIVENRNNFLFTLDYYIIYHNY